MSTTIREALADSRWCKSFAFSLGGMNSVRPILRAAIERLSIPSSCRQLSKMPGSASWLSCVVLFIFNRISAD